MEDGELEFTDHEVFAGCDLCDLPSTPSTTGSMESFLDELLKSTHTCTHTHTCNPPGPDNTHTHTCYHTHTQLFATGEEDDSTDKSETPTGSTAKKRPLGNREAVRKYREKKKAHTAYLEEQVNHLRALNQQLVKRLQGQASIESEVVRLRSLLAEFRERVDAEIGSFPSQKPCPNPTRAAPVGDCNAQALPGGYCLNSVSVPCVTDVPCFHTSGSDPLSRTADGQNLETLKWPDGSSNGGATGRPNPTVMPLS